ncbi:hypothetical protein ABZ281_12425 [Streptomyces sp. NPDC006265]|uniref:hypothetical protein n=1 Tax=Streptomyces sp. NPDC006265 TaxID=3156740 RepID=UPI0033A6327F
MNQRSSRREKILTIIILILGCIVLAAFAGLIGDAYGRDPVDWASWTFGTAASLGVVICFGFWQMEP